MGNVIELRERDFSFNVARTLVRLHPMRTEVRATTANLKFLNAEVKPEGLTEYSPGRQPWDKDLIIFLALKGRYIILIQFIV